MYIYFLTIFDYYFQYAIKYLKYGIYVSEKSISRTINVRKLVIRTLVAGMTTAEQYREQHCTYHLILFAASVSCGGNISAFVSAETL